MRRPGAHRGEVIIFPREADGPRPSQERRAWLPRALGVLFGAELLAWGLWLGAMVAIALAAPVVFQLVPSRDLAGRVFGAILGRLFPMTYACGLVLLAAGGARLLLLGRVTRLDAARYGLVAAMLLVAAFVGVALLGEMNALQLGFPGPIETLPADSGARLRFNQLHRLSERLMGVDVVLGLALLPLLLARRTAAHRGI